jgi:thiol-disulfide isomerase/thioredoxin
MVRFAAAALALAITSFGVSAYGAESQILLLDFWSPQCGPCMSMKPTMHSLEQANYPIREIDTTHDFQTSQQFNVHSIPCFVMLVDGQEVERKVGATSIQDLEQMFEKAKDIVVQRHHFRGATPEPGTSPRQLVANTAQGPAPRLDSTPPSQQPNAGRPIANVAIPVTSTSTGLGPIAGPPATASDFPPNLMTATVRIRVEDPQGRSSGTGTIIDSRSGEALILTCGHLFRESKGKGQMTVELFDVGPNGAQASGQFPGTLISYNLERDVAFVSIKPNRQVSVAQIAPDHTAVGRGDRVATIGCSNGKDPTLLPQRINNLDHYLGPANIEVSGAPEEGRSGGGLFNLQGQLIGVCYAADYEGKEGLYAALDSVHGELDRLGLKDIYAKKDASSKGGDLAAIPPAANPPLVRGQEPRDPVVTPLPAITAAANAESKTNPAQNLNPADQASFDEIMKRSATSEIVVIVRPKTPGGQSEVITLDNASPDLVRALEARQRSPQQPLTK